ncbi:MAG TPA: 50S ribosomal protein L18 [Candidatus Binatia bacterium]|nr:50S ribosomal protein L18 [Candidatus Binatia bacterium]
MATGASYVVTFRRKREGKTDYRKRLTLLRSRSARVVVRKSLKHIAMQIITYAPQGDKVTVSAHTSELAKHGWKGGTDNLSAAYLCGMLLAHKAKQHKITKAVPDLGMYPSVKGSKLYAALKGAVDGGLHVPLDNKIVPDVKRLRGEHIAHWATLLKKDDARYKKMFSRYLKSGLAPENLPAHFDDMKKKLG